MIFLFCETGGSAEGFMLELVMFQFAWLKACLPQEERIATQKEKK